MSGAPAWWANGESHLGRLIANLPADEWDAPSLLPGWTRRTVVAHLAHNADALNNLVTWARTGVETPMYASPTARDEDIARSATQSVATLQAAHQSAAARLRDGAARLTDEQWEASVRTAQGRTVPARELVWMRSREVWMHAVDLDFGAGFADAPSDYLKALIDDVLRSWTVRGEEVNVQFVDTDSHAMWTLGSPDRTSRGTLAELAARVTGRSPTEIPLPRWL